MFDFDDITPQAAQKLIDEKKCYIVDVRTPEEYRAFHIAGACLLPTAELHSRYNEIPRKPDKPVLICCEHGARSVAVCALLAQYGWSRLLNLEGGAEAWRASGLPVVSGNAPAPENPEETAPVKEDAAQPDANVCECSSGSAT